MVRKYCDLCGCETRNLQSENLLISFNGNYENRKTFDICDCCKDILNEKKRRTEVDFVEQSKIVAENGINYGEFKQVGNCEQGGVVCPKCGRSNNMYFFKGICEHCGYRKERD